jgi:anti-sigma regulatory factor (Ser/Thr protein kinase)
MTFAHPALFYRGTDDYLARTVPFITDALVANEPIAVAVPTPRLALLCAELGSDADRVHMVNMSEAGRNPGRIIPAVLRAFADRHPGPVRIIGEPIWPSRSPAEYPACAQHEALINRAFAGRDATILCPYDTAGLQPEVLDDALVTHPVVIDGDGSRQSPGFAPDSMVAAYNEPLAVPMDAVAQTTDGGLADVRRFVTKYATDAGLDRVEDLVLTVDELAANSIRHGGGTGTVYFWTEPGHVVCQVADRGHLADPLAGRIPAGLDQIGGRGLLMVNHLADLVRTHTTPAGTEIRVYFAA